MQEARSRGGEDRGQKAPRSGREEERKWRVYPESREPETLPVSGQSALAASARLVPALLESRLGSDYQQKLEKRFSKPFSFSAPPPLVAAAKMLLLKSLLPLMFAALLLPVHCDIPVGFGARGRRRAAAPGTLAGPPTPTPTPARRFTARTSTCWVIGSWP